MSYSIFKRGYVLGVAWLCGVRSPVVLACVGVGLCFPATATLDSMICSSVCSAIIPLICAFRTGDAFIIARGNYWRALVLGGTLLGTFINPETWLSLTKCSTEITETHPDLPWFLETQPIPKPPPREYAVYDYYHNEIKVNSHYP